MNFQTIGDFGLFRRETMRRFIVMLREYWNLPRLVRSENVKNIGSSWIFVAAGGFPQADHAAIRMNY